MSDRPDPPEDDPVAPDEGPSDDPVVDPESEPVPSREGSADDPAAGTGDGAGETEGDPEPSGDDQSADGDEGPEGSTTSGRQSRVPERPSKARSRPAPRSDRRPSPTGRRRSRVRTARLALVVTLALLVARVVTLVVSDADPSGWAWLSLAVVIGAVVLAGRNLLEQTGRLNPLRNRGLGGLALVLSLAAASLGAVLVTGSSPELGLDLQGGFSVVLTAKGDPPSDNVDQAMEIIRQRIDGLGVAEPEVTRQGDNVVVELPGVKDRQKAQELVGRTALLEFRPVLAQGLPFDAEAAAADRDPCAAGAAGAATPPAGGSTEPGTPADPTEPGAPADPTDPAATEPPTTGPSSEPDPTTPPAGDDEGATARPLPGPSGVVDGETAAPALGRQDDGGTTTTGEDPTTTAPPDPTTTTPVGSVPEPVPTEGTGSPEAGVDETVVFPTQEAEGEPRSCVQLGPAGFTGDALSRSRAELGGETGSQWVVSVAIKQSRRADANALMNSCQSAAPTCSTGQMAIVLDEEVVSAPTVNDPNLADDDFLISGGGDSGFSEAEAKDLALVLRYGALPVEFTRSAERQVSPSLGSDSLRAGLLAGALGLAAVALYLIVYYRALGILVVAGLAVWSILMYGLVCWLSATRGLTLSLSGVVGIVVSVGTTVDSYVLHFERLKDEVRLGKSVRASTERGFQMAFRTILTANIAALMGAVLLWYLTVGAVRGFAFFLGLSVLLDLFVIYTFERPTVALLARSRFFTEHPRFGVARGLGRSGRTATAPAGAKP